MNPHLPTPTATTASPAADDRPPAPAPGPAVRWIARFFFRAAEVSDSRPLGGGLHRIGLEGPALRGLAWAPGDKLQVRLGSGLQTRTYTPIRWDAQHGRTELLAHALAAGPGSAWARQAAPGQAVFLLGPRRALNLAGLDPEHSVVVGDETTVALAAAWRPAHALFEAANAPAVQAALAAVGVHGSALPTRPDDAHLDELTRAVLRIGNSTA